VDLRARLDGYEVTAVPPRRSPLTLVWSEPDDEAEDCPRDGDRRGAVLAVLAVLDDYRITRIPGRAAS